MLAARDVTLNPPRLREIWVLPHSHVDIGYTHLQDEVIDIQIANLLQGIELARASAGNPDGLRFKWNPEAIWVLEHFLERATPEQRALFIEAVRRGDVGVDGLYANMLTGLCRPEELAQCLRYGTRIAELTGVPVDTAAICDVPGWTWGLTTMMGQAGIKYFMIGPNHSARIGTIHQWDNRPFYWQSPSGRERVLCYVVDNYHFLGDLEQNILRHSERLARSDYPYDLTPMFWVGTWPGGGVDNAPPDADLVAKAKAWNDRYAAPRVVISLASEFFHEFERRYGAELPSVCGGSYAVLGGWRGLDRERNGDEPGVGGTIGAGGDAVCHGGPGGARRQGTRGWRGRTCCFIANTPGARITASPSPMRPL